MGGRDDDCPSARTRWDITCSCRAAVRACCPQCPWLPRSGSTAARPQRHGTGAECERQDILRTLPGTHDERSCVVLAAFLCNRFFPDLSCRSGCVLARMMSAAALRSMGLHGSARSDLMAALTNRCRCCWCNTCCWWNTFMALGVAVRRSLLAATDMIKLANHVIN